MGERASAEAEPRAESRKDAILDAALRVFSEVGYAKATTKRIAAAAELRSPGLIYWYFSNKEELLRAVVLRYAVVLRVGAGDRGEALDVPPDEFLRRLARGGLAFFADARVRQMYRLMMSEWPLLEKLGVTLRARPENVYTFCERYLSRQIELGALRPHDASAAARAFIAQIWAQVEARYFFPLIYPSPPDDDAFIESLVTMFLDGLRPRRAL